MNLLPTSQAGKGLLSEIEQGADEWFALRSGRFTASDIIRIIPGGKGLDSYILELVDDMFNPQPITPGFDNPATRWGKKYEDQALLEFSEETDLLVGKSGFIPYEDYFGCSPDGIILNENAGLELKCPYKRSVHIQYVEGLQRGSSLKKVMSKYYWQVMSSIYFTDADHWYFASFDPRLKGPNRLHYVKVFRDAADILILKDAMKVAVDKLIYYLNQYHYDYVQE